MNHAPVHSCELPAASPPARVAGFRTKLLIAMMLLVCAITALALYFAQHSVAASFERDLAREYQAELGALHHAQQIRHAALVERCHALLRRPRIIAALEEDYELYPNAEPELRDVMEGGAVNPAGASGNGLHAQFYRFLDRRGALIPAPHDRAGPLALEEAALLSLPGAPDRQHVGYLLRADRTLAEVIAMPMFSTETGEVIAALVLGFKPFEIGGKGPNEMKSGIWLNGRLHTVSLGAPAAAAVDRLMHGPSAPGHDEISTPIMIEGMAHLLFAKRLNPGSLYPPALEVCVFPLADLVNRQRQLRWQVVGAGTVLLLVGLAASHFASGRLSAPVERLALDSERSARFSADASHQLKTPVTVLRAGLEELLAQDNLTPEECNQLAALIHQTYRLSTLIEDLLLLSRMDSGRLELQLSALNLTELIEASLDDLSALPDELGLEIETAFPADLYILGEKRHTAIILLNLLENARKYNRRGGIIRITARQDGDAVLLSIANTGQPIPAPARAHIFERFHRGAIGENVPGYGLGLNLARELARLHQGDLRLNRSDADWTEFEACFRRAPMTTGGPV